LFNLLSILDPVQFFDSKIFEDQLEPNKYLNEIAKNITKQNVDTNSLLKILNNISDTNLGSTISKKSDFLSLKSILKSKKLSYSDIARAKRHISELNTLASLFTRTRKADTPENRAIREPIDLNVSWTVEEKQAYALIRNWFMERAKSKGQIPGFMMQMPLRQAASCLPAMYELMKDNYNFTEEEIEEDDWDSVLDEQETVMPIPSEFVPLRDLPRIEKATYRWLCFYWLVN
jgi:hypothetical protein